MFAELKASRHQASLILTLSNPKVKNALHPDMYVAAIEALSTAERDDSIRAVILTGEDDFFCSGENVNRLLESRKRSVAAPADALDHLHGWIDALRGCPKPIIAAIEGAAVGAGFSLALACDLIVAGASARFMMAYVKVGLTPDGGGSWFLTQALPRQLVMEIMLEGKPITAQRLHEVGIVNKVVADGTALQTAINWADALAEQSPNAVEGVKSLIIDAETNTLAEHFTTERECFIEALHHPDALEGMHAFLDKRKPRY